LATWLAETGEERGEVVSAQTMFDLSGDWYGGRLDVDWSPPTPADAEAMFAKHGLTGDFWSLSPASG
jgi:hypothetical protein